MAGRIIHTVDEAIEYINEIGFLPLFKNEIPVFANYRRDGYDFDALYEDGKAPNKHKKIMTHFGYCKEESFLYDNETMYNALFYSLGARVY